MHENKEPGHAQQFKRQFSPLPARNPSQTASTQFHNRMRQETRQQQSYLSAEERTGSAPLIRPRLLLPAHTRQEVKLAGSQSSFSQPSLEKADAYTSTPERRIADYDTVPMPVLHRPSPSSPALPAQPEISPSVSPSRPTLFSRIFIAWKLLLLMALVILPTILLELLLTGQLTYQIVILVISVIILSNILGHEVIKYYALRSFTIIKHTLSTQAVRISNAAGNARKTADSSRDSTLRVLSTNTTAYLQALRLKLIRDKQDRSISQ